jgi:hypothetical protein
VKAEANVANGMRVESSKRAEGVTSEEEEGRRCAK